jgi:glycosyltransferase involved in cell wall biosynthesis
MKIAIILFGDYLKDGRVQRSAEALSQNHNVKVFVTTDPKENYPSEYNDVPIQFIDLKTKKLSKHPIVQILKFIEYFIVTSIHINRFNPDVVFCNDVYTLFFGWFFKKQRKKFVYDSHELWKDTMHHYAYNKRLYKILTWVQNKTIKKADVVITVNESIANILKEDHKITKPVVIMNISEITELVDKQKIDLFRTIDESKKIVLYIGGIAAGRGLEYIIESIQYWKDNIEFAILGSGAYEPKLVELSDKLGVANKVHFLGSVLQKDVLSYASACDAGIMAIQSTCRSYYYCLPNKFFQLAQLRKPILGSNFPEISKLINDYKLGTTFNPNKPKEIAESVNRLFFENFHIAEEDHKKFIETYNWNHEEAKLLSLINNFEKLK